MLSRRTMANRIYRDMRVLRRDVEALIDANRIRITEHARTRHPELTDTDRIAIVRWGTLPKPDEDRPLTDGVYVCWLNHPRLGRCRGCFCVEEHGGVAVLIITAFRE